STEALNCYAQTGVLSGTVSINDEPDLELYLFGEKVRNLGNRANISGCKFTTILGNTPATGFYFHLTDISVPYAFNNLPLGFVLQGGGDIVPLKDLDIDIQPQTSNKLESFFKANFNAEEEYKVKGKVTKPIVFDSVLGWSGCLEFSFIEFKIKQQQGFGLIISGEINEKLKRPEKALPVRSFPKNVPLTVQFTNEISQFGVISGGKGSSLGKLTQLSKDNEFIVPRGIIVTTAAYEEFLTPEILGAVKYLENVAYGNRAGDLKDICKKVSNIVEKTPLPDEICQSITEDLKHMYGDEVDGYKFAVRSSST
ncbi:putative phosphoenolpyruvate synthase, partial [Nephila pilipes]